jgi:hypothetical protein
VDRLRTAEAQYKIECQQREAEAEARNQELDKLISNLAFDVESAIHEYVGIVLSNSAYPDPFPVSHDHEFDLSSRELRLTVTVPQPSDVPAVKEYRYVKAKDEITRRCCRSKPGRTGTPERFTRPRSARCTRSSKPIAAARSTRSHSRSARKPCRQPPDCPTLSRW